MSSSALGGSVKSRLIASLAVGAAVVLSTTGCNMIAPQATTIEYAAAEGINVPDSGPVEVRNAFIVATEDGAQGNFIAALINDTDSAQTLNIELDGGISETVRIPAYTTISLGADAEPLLIDGLDALPGTAIEGYFESGGTGSPLVDVPVLDGALDYLAPLVP
ncbi:DNA modification methylase [Microbacterium sp. C7(2022)]|uniref:DNA modification methylase n=1 Tax=Microbacterium sp. C7(2022) TaxID=2992759 RepID=UPI00237C1896|nr:DNA modification methylase [Microbacterium sp. C7(2022)]MDE0547133.1 DNA modification methylase [Microbacterium sp. C7(2022)]